MKKYILVALFALVGKPSARGFGGFSGFGGSAGFSRSGAYVSYSSPKCSKKNLCLEKMRKIYMDAMNKETISQEDFTQGINAARKCAGMKKEASDHSMKKQYNNLEKKTWKEVIQNTDKKSRILPCLQAIRCPSGSGNPCLSKMDDIPMNITSANDYVRGMKAAYSCAGWKMNKAEEELVLEYNSLTGPKSTWTDIINQRESKLKQEEQKLSKEDDQLTGPKSTWTDTTNQRNPKIAQEEQKLSKEYNNLIGARTKWSYRGNQRDLGDPIMPCLKVIKG